MGENTRKVCEIRILQVIHWEKEGIGEKRIIDRTIALIDSEYQHNQYTRLFNVQNKDKKLFLEELMKEIGGVLY